MTNNRKRLESLPEAASLDRTMPAPPTPAEQGKKLGGITRTADSAIRAGDATADSGEIPVAGPAGKPPGEGTGSSAAKQTKAARRPADDAAQADENTPEDESALESLGRAIGAPLSGEAADDEPRR